VRETGLHGGLVAEIARQMHDANLRMIGRELVEQVGAAVVRTVVDENDFLPRAGLENGIAHTAKQLRQSADFVVYRQHGANQDFIDARAEHAACDPCSELVRRPCPQKASA